MGVGGGFQIGRSALAASRLGVEVASNNLANAATPGYSRQSIELEPLPGDGTSFGGQIGRGVRFTGVRRHIDPAIEARLNASISEAAAADEILRSFGGIEAVLNELTDLDLSSELGAFFTSWSELANGTQAQAQVIEQGELLAGFIRRVRGDIAEQRDELDTRLGSLVTRADAILDEIGRLNERITSSESGGTQNNPLRDQRDELVRELSGLVEITTVEQASGAIDVLVGSSPVVLSSTSQGIELREIPKGNTIERTVAIKTTAQILDVEQGQIGGVLGSRDGTIDDTLERLDTLASRLIFEINRLHSTGTTADGLTSVHSTLAVSPSDQTLALNHPSNSSLASLPFAPTNGGFLVRTLDETSGAVRTTRIDIDLDGIDSAGQAGYDDDTTLADIATQLDAVSGIGAVINGDGTLSITASAGTSFSFGDDSSGVLAVLGVNSYFVGEDATDISVRASLSGNPLSLMTGRYENDTFVENETSLQIAALQDKGLDALGGESAAAFWRSTVQTLSVRTGSAKATAEAAALVRDGLESQRLAMSGVDEDEEALNLMSFQRAYQGAARIIQTTNEMLETLFALV